MEKFSERIKKLKIGFSLGFLISILYGAQPTWTVYWNGAGNSVDAPTSIVVDPNGNIYIAGFTDGTGEGTSGYDLVVLSYDPNGNLRWQPYIYNGPLNNEDGANAIILGDDGNLYITGIRTSQNAYDVVTISLTTNGDERWKRFWNNSMSNDKDLGWCITQDENGNIYVGGNTKVGGDYDLFVLSYDKNGNFRWVNYYNGAASSHDKAYSIVYDNGYVYAAGYSVESGNYPDILVVKFDTNGVRKKVFTYDIEGLSDMAYKIIKDNSGYLYVAGRTQSSSTGWDYTILKLDENLNLIKEYIHTLPYYDYDQSVSLVYGADGNIYSVGHLGNKFTTISLTSQLNPNWIYKYVPSGNAWGRASSIILLICPLFLDRFKISIFIIEYFIRCFKVEA